jgi:hypothetical protein
VAVGAPYVMAGKTGTAQVISRKGTNAVNPNLPMHLRHRALFVGFAPVDNPVIAIAVAVEAAATAQHGRADRAQGVRCLPAGQDAAGAGRRARPPLRAMPKTGAPLAPARHADGAASAPAPEAPAAAPGPQRRHRPDRSRRDDGFLRWLGDLAHRLRTLDWPLCAALGALMVIGLAGDEERRWPASGDGPGRAFRGGHGWRCGASRGSALRIRSGRR